LELEIGEEFMKREQSEPQGSKDSDLPAKLSQPALRALTQAGYTRLDLISKLSEDEILALHGVGPKAIVELRSALAAKGLSFASGKRK
jgi:hypothetical protein